MIEKKGKDFVWKDSLDRLKQPKTVPKKRKLDYKPKYTKEVKTKEGFKNKENRNNRENNYTKSEEVLKKPAETYKSTVEVVTESQDKPYFSQNRNNRSNRQNQNGTTRIIDMSASNFVPNTVSNTQPAEKKEINKVVWKEPISTIVASKPPTEIVKTSRADWAKFYFK